MRERAAIITIDVAVVLLLGALGWRFHSRGGPYLTPPQTVMEHVAPWEHETHAALLVLPRVARLIPRKSEVACFRPFNGEAREDTANYLTAIGQLPHHKVVPSFTAGRNNPREQLVEYVVAVREPFDHPAYRLMAEWPEGRVYKVVR